MARLLKYYDSQPIQIRRLHFARRQDKLIFQKKLSTRIKFYDLSKSKSEWGMTLIYLIITRDYERFWPGDRMKSELLHFIINNVNKYRLMLQGWADKELMGWSFQVQLILVSSAVSK